MKVAHSEPYFHAVLWMLENKIMPDYMIGVSAGAAYGVSMASGQIGRNLKILIDYRNDKRYVGLSNMVHRDNRSLYGLNFTFDTIPNELVPYDYDAFLRYKGTFKCVVTNVLTGKPEYKTFTGYDRTNQLLRATCALPLAFPLIYLDGTPYLDGGLSDSIPFEKAFEDGCDRVIVVLRSRQPAQCVPLQELSLNILKFSVIFFFVLNVTTGA